jgi:hypothetical protein
VEALASPTLGCRAFSRVTQLFQVFPRAPFSHHLKEQILDNHQEEEHLALLAAGHPRQHLKQFGVYFVGKRKAIITKVRHAKD